MTANIATVQDLICSQDDAPHTCHPQQSLFYVAPPIVVHFNCVKSAAEYLLETAADACQELSDLIGVSKIKAK